MADFKQITVSGVSHPVKDEVARQGLAGKQDKLTFDDTPTANSNNPVKSGGVYQAIQDIDVSSQISGKADKSEMSVVAGTGANVDKTTITLKSGTSATVLTQHQDVSGKEDKSNKVTSFSSPTDTQYPSAKLVNDQLATKQGTISDLSTIRSGASAGATAYQKPGTGIPPTDLASAVQTSLGKADTAIQSVTVGTTTTGAAGSSASVTNTGTATEPVLSFTIPQGAQGIQGIQGPQGERGPQGNTGVQVDSIASIIHSIDPTATYAAADVAGADAVQDVLSEVTELGGEVDAINDDIAYIKDWMPPFEERQVELIRGTGGYGKMDGGTTSYKISGASWFSGGIPVSKGETVIATLNGLNSAVAPIVYRNVSTVTANAPAGTYTPLCTYDSSNQYKVTIENDGYIFASFLYDENNPVNITIRSKRDTFNEVVASLETEDANLQDNIDELDAKIEDAIPSESEQITASYGRSGYVGADGGSDSYRIDHVSAISQPIAVQKGDMISVNITSGINNAAAPISYKATSDYSNSAPAGTFTPLCVYDSSTTEYSGVAPDDGYVFLTFDPNIETIVNIVHKTTIDAVVQSLRDSDNSIQENVNQLGSELDEISPLKTKQVQALHGRAGYVGTNGGSDSYRIGGVSAISQPIAVQKGDRVSVTITNGINNAAAPISYKATPNYSASAAAGTFTPLCVYSAGVTDYSGLAPDDGYIFLTFDPNIETIVNISKRTLLPWYGKKWACVGDSLTEVNNTATKRYYDYVSENTGITTVNMGAGGTGYKRAESSNLAFYQRILNIDTSVDVVTIFGSFNDLNYSVMGDYSSFDEMLGNYDDVFDENSDSNTLAACINKTIDNLQSVIPLVRVGIVAPCPWVSTRPETNPNGSASKYVDMLKKIAAYHSIPFLDLWRESNLRPWDVDFRNLAYSHDSTGQDGNPAGTHPDENGHAILAPKFKDFLEMLIL